MPFCAFFLSAARPCIRTRRCTHMEKPPPPRPISISNIILSKYWLRYIAATAATAAADDDAAAAAANATADDAADDDAAADDDNAVAADAADDDAAADDDNAELRISMTSIT